MKHYGLEIPEGSSIKNLTAPQGSPLPSNPNAGEMFFLTTDGALYVHTGVAWTRLNGQVVDTSVTVDTFTGTGSPSNVDFTITTAPNSENELLVYVGGVYQEQSTYSVSGTTLTLTESPANGVGVEVVLLPTSISGVTLAEESTVISGSPPQQTFTVNYTPGNIFVYLNGIKLVNLIDYTATNGTSVTLSSPPAIGDIISFEVFDSFSVAETPDVIPKSQPFSIQFLLTDGWNDTWTLLQSAAFAFTIDKAYYQTSTGTITGDIKIEGTSVTGLSALSVTTTEGNSTATAANGVVVGDKITMVTTNGEGSPLVTMMSMCIECTRA